jgi:O-methyltransferase
MTVSTAAELVNNVRDRNLTYLSEARLLALVRCADELDEREVPGDFFEFGVALGGSGICMAHRLGPDRRYVGFDVFGMIPPPTAADGPVPQQRFNVIQSGRSRGIGGEPYYGYRPDLISEVQRSFSEFGVPIDGKRRCLVVGRFEVTLAAYSSAVVALAHVDCDWYEPVKCCLSFLRHRLAVGGRVVLDDYNDWPGCKKASDEFLDAHPQSFELITTRPNAVLEKVGADVESAA